jgi:NAD-specific glutamate dehydrogenase
MYNLLGMSWCWVLHRDSKNKDIPEGGSKGVICLSLNQQHKSKIAFQKYIDAMLDLLVGHGLRDLYQKPTVLFFGPDEGTAEFMGALVEIETPWGSK